MKQNNRPWANKAGMLAPLAALILTGGIHWLLPDGQLAVQIPIYSYLIVSAVLIYAALLALTIRNKKLKKALIYKGPLLTAAFLLLGLWDLSTLKMNWLPLPYFAGPDKILNALINDWQTLTISTLFSLRLLATGYIIGALMGAVTGVFIGWSQRGNYWLGPVIKIIGPIPATAWIPIAMVVFPTSFWASVFLIALAVWFPVTVMTSSGIANVRNSYFEVARTLGAGQSYLIMKVAIPAAAPNIFIGLFMGLGASFITLIVAEMLGVKAGLGWYINWAQGWAEYSKVYATLLVIALLFSGLIFLIFKIKDKLLVWQRGLIKW